MRSGLQIHCSVVLLNHQARVDSRFQVLACYHNTSFCLIVIIWPTTFSAKRFYLLPHVPVWSCIMTVQFPFSKLNAAQVMSMFVACHGTGNCVLSPWEICSDESSNSTWPQTSLLEFIISGSSSVELNFWQKPRLIREWRMTSCWGRSCMHLNMGTHKNTERKRANYQIDDCWFVTNLQMLYSF